MLATLGLMWVYRVDFIKEILILRSFDARQYWEKTTWAATYTVLAEETAALANRVKKFGITRDALYYVGRSKLNRSILMSRAILLYGTKLDRILCWPGSRCWASVELTHLCYKCSALLICNERCCLFSTRTVLNDAIQWCTNEKFPSTVLLLDNVPGKSNSWVSDLSFLSFTINRQTFVR